MRTLAMVFFSAAFLSLTGVQAATTTGDIGDGAPVAKTQAGLMRVAVSNAKSPNKLADKYLDGKSGGMYGVGGSEPHVKYFKNKKKKAQPCCRATPK